MPPKPFSDGPDYEAIGWGISEGLGLSTHLSNPEWQSGYLAADPQVYAAWRAKSGPIVPRTDRPPLLPLVIGGIYQILGQSQMAFMAVRVFLAVCLSMAGALAVFTSYRFTNLYVNEPPQGLVKTWFSPLAPLFAAVVAFTLALFDSNVRRYMEDFLTEMPAFVLTQIFLMILLVNIRKRNPIAGFVLAGFVFGLMIYCRSLFVSWIPGLFLLLFVLRYAAFRTIVTGRLKRAGLGIFQSSIVIVVALIVISPWCIRNCLVLKSFMPLGTKGPITLLGGYCDEAVLANGDWRNEPERYWRSVLEKSYGDELETSPSANLNLELELVHIAKREVKSWIKANIGMLPKLAVMRLCTHFNPYSGLSGLVKAIAILGIVIAIIHRPLEATCLVGIVLINASVVAAMYSVGGRFFVPLYGVMYLFCAVGCTFIAFQFSKVLPTAIHR